MFTLFKTSGKIKTKPFNYYRSGNKNELSYKNYVLGWLTHFGLDIMTNISNNEGTGGIDFIMLDKYSDDLEKYCISTVGGDGYRIGAEFVEEFSNYSNKFGGIPVIITTGHLTNEAQSLAKLLGVEIINESRLKGINQFMLSDMDIELNMDSKMFLYRLIYYIKKALKED